MKRIFYLFAVLIFVFSLFSCNSAKDVDAKKETADIEEVTTVEETDAEVTTEDTTEAETTAEETTAEDTTVPPTTTASDPVTTYPAVTTAPPANVDGLWVYSPVSSMGYTHTGLPSLESVGFYVNDPYNKRGLSSSRNGFSYGVASGGTPHSITVNNQSTFDAWGTNALAWDNKTWEKVLYLTFDCGYKYGDITSRILNTLKEKNVKAAFFCTLDYLDDEPEVISRMINEGHIVGNHTATHPDCTTISRERLAKEILGVHNYMRVHYGYSPSYFRFPTGAFSQDALELVSSVGYRSAFWSVAYVDWDPANQQGVEISYSQVTSRLHPGAVILLHSTSPDNAEILGRVIDYAHSQGYEFRSLDQYAYWN